MGWRIVEVNTDEYLKLYLNNLLITRLSEKILINIRDIDLLIMHNDRASMSIKLLNALTSQNVSVVFMDGQHEPASYLLPVSGNHMSLKVLQAQINWTNTFKGLVWKHVVQNKIANQRHLLQRQNLIDATRSDEYQKLIDHVNSFDITNREGHAAKIYWHDQYGLNFIRDYDSKTSPVINAMLNYGYAILRSLTITAILKKGLDSRISFYHKSLTNFFALASDLMEPFRQLVDEVVYQHRSAATFTFEIRDALIGIAERRVMVNQVGYQLSAALDVVAANIANGNGWSWVVLWD